MSRWRESEFIPWLIFSPGQRQVPALPEQSFPASCLAHWGLTLGVKPWTGSLAVPCLLGRFVRGRRPIGPSWVLMTRSPQAQSASEAVVGKMGSIHE